MLLERNRGKLTGMLLAFLLLSVSGSVEGQASRETAPPATFYEFGTVVAILRSGVETQVYDELHHRFARHSFQFAKDTRADVVRTGDAVEMIYSVGDSVWTLRRMIMLEAGLPRAGPPSAAISSGTAVAPLAPAPSPSPSVAAASMPALKRTEGRGHTVASASRAPAIPAPVPRAVAKPKPVDLSGNTTAKTPAITDVPLGIVGGYSKPAPVPVTHTVSRDTPSEECNRSSADWPNEPLRIAVLDFRYPTEREEAHDIGKTGGGSGTAVADLVFTRLDDLHEYQMVRGDRRRLDRADIAGAAKLGRELGADAVLEGTFAPTDMGKGPDGEETRARTYELRAGLVDTCTGQVLMKMSSAACIVGSGAAGCPHFTVSAREAGDPDANARSFDPAIRTLIYPLEHNATPATMPDAIGLVVDVGKDSATVHMMQGSARIGDQLSIHAQRLSKNPGTYTLQKLQDQEIGRFTVRRVQGATVFGSYTGDLPARPGDAVEVIPIQ